MAHVTLKPLGLRELHWHPNSGEWQYFIHGKGRMTLFHIRLRREPPISTPAISGTSP
jgi:oxalate decarboxylase/phosphoglucose isomerase-like protein (cupin superfamily)